MNRRSFISRGAVSLALAPLAGSTVFLTGCPNLDWIAIAQKDIPVIVSIVESLVGVALTASGNGALTPVVLVAIKASAAAAQAGLTTLTQIVADEKAQPNTSTIQKIEIAISDIGLNLSSILAALPVSIPSGLMQTISAGIALGISTLSSITLLIPAQVSTNSAKKASMQRTVMTAIKLPDNQTLASMFNVVAVANGYASHQVTVK